MGSYDLNKLKKVNKGLQLLCDIYDQGLKRKSLEYLMMKRNIYRLSQLLNLEREEYFRLFDANIRARINKALRKYYENNCEDIYSKKYRGDVEFIGRTPIPKRSKNVKKDI